jgi:hypothetical protein
MPNPLSVDDWNESDSDTPAGAAPKRCKNAAAASRRFRELCEGLRGLHCGMSCGVGGAGATSTSALRCQKLSNFPAHRVADQHVSIKLEDLNDLRGIHGKVAN